MNYLYLSTTTINKENYKEELFNLLDPLDADFTGTNGDEYTGEYLINKGFNSRLEYSIHKACKEKDNLKDIVNSVLNDATDYWSNYYNNTEISIVDIDNQLVVSVATSCN